jgi:hypothetical protein
LSVACQSVDKGGSYRIFNSPVFDGTKKEKNAPSAVLAWTQAQSLFEIRSAHEEMRI